MKISASKIIIIMEVSPLFMLSRQEFFVRARRGPYTTEELYSAYEAYATCPAFPRNGDFYCRRCGSCCRRPWRIEASVYDIQRWIAEKRLDIIEGLEYRPKRGPPAGLTLCEVRSLEMMCAGLLEMDEAPIALLAFSLGAAREGALIMPKDAEGCAYYDGEGCEIYATRPGVCARFPDARLFRGLAALLQKG